MLPTRERRCRRAAAVLVLTGLYGANCGFPGAAAAGAVPALHPGGEMDAADRVPPARRTVHVADGVALADAVADLHPGDHVVLRPGVYDSPVTIAVGGTAESPVVIRAETLLQSTVTGRFVVNADHVTVYGIEFRGPETGVRVVNCIGVRILRNRITQWRHVGLTLAGGRGAEVGFNEFTDPHEWVAGESSYPLRIGLRSSERGPDDFHYGAHIHHNHFHAFPPKPDPRSYHSGQSDAIEFAQTGRAQPIQAGWIVEYNLIENHRQNHGIIDLKSGGSTIRFNTLLDVHGGRIDARTGGTGNKIIANWIEDGSIGANGGDHEIIGNVVTGGAIRVHAGNGPWDNYQGGRAPSAYRVKVIGNRASLTVGHAYTANEHKAVGTVVEAHDGPISYGQHEGTVVRDATAVAYPRAFRLTPAEVGPFGRPRHGQP